MISALMRAIPDFKGKRRLARFLFKNQIKKISDEIVTGKYNCRFKVPNITETIGFELFINGTYEHDLVSFIVKSIPKNSILLDIGSNIGSISIPVCKQRNDIYPICIEASPWIFEYLEFNFELNSIRQARLLNFAISDKGNQEVSFYSPRDKFGKGSMASVFTSESIAVTTTTIDQIVSSLSPGQIIGLIKIDVEGFEYHAFLGGKSFLSSDLAPDILFEFVDWAEDQAMDVRAGAAQKLLLSCGYFIYTFENGKVSEKLKTSLTTGAAMFFASKKELVK